MATILNDTELKKLFGTVIKGADEKCIRPNSYILRLGSHGAFINTDKEFEIKQGKGIRLAPGHAVGITALEKIDFSKSTVHQIFPECDLHGFLSPTTDLSREGLTAPSTQIDAGYKGTLNWTINNTSSKPADFVYGEKLFRLTIFRLGKGEKPESLYTGDYQEQEGYVASKRSGAPRGMKTSDWVDSSKEGGPEEKMEELMNTGYPWNIVGTQFKMLDDKLKIATNEYADIRDSIKKLDQQMSGMQKTIKDTVEEVLSNREYKSLAKAVTAFIGLLGLFVTLTSNTAVWNYIVSNRSAVGIILLVLCTLLTVFFVKKRK